eukprot:472790_1
MSTTDTLTTLDQIVSLTFMMGGGYIFYLTNDVYMSIAFPLSALIIYDIVTDHDKYIQIGSILAPFFLMYIWAQGTNAVLKWVIYTDLFWMIISVVAVFIVSVFLFIVVVLLTLIINIYMEKPITGHTCACIERYTYGHLYKNNPIPSHIYQLNYQHENIWNCNLCDKPFHSNTSQVIITCGHRFHAECLRKEELDHFTHSPSLHITHRCPRLSGCNTEYNWRQKWEYTHINKDYFMQIRDETLLKVLPDAIEDIVLQFIN